jgi:hypothetical protein
MIGQIPLLVEYNIKGSSSFGDSIKSITLFTISLSSLIGFVVGYNDLARFSTVGNLKK